MIKKLISILLVLCMIIPCAATAAQDESSPDIGDITFSLSGETMRGGLTVTNDGKAHDIMAVSAAFSDSGKTQLTDCKLNYITLKSADTQKYVTLDCAKPDNGGNMSVYFWDKTTLEPLSAPKDYSDAALVTKVYSDDSAYADMVDSYFAIHMQTGVYTVGGVKTLLSNMPYYNGDECMVTKTPMAKAIGLQASAIVDSGSNVTIKTKNIIGSDITLTVGSTEMKVGDKTVTVKAPRWKNHMLYLPLTAIAEACGKKVYRDNTAINGGMVIIGDTEFTPPTSADKLQELNDYLCFMRPSAQRVFDDYQNSATKGVHPRVILTPDKVTKIKAECNSNSVQSTFYTRLYGEAKKTVNNKPALVKHYASDGLRMLDQADQFEAYMFILGLAYQLSADNDSYKTKFAEEAWRQIEAVANFPDWNPVHHLDTAVFSAGFAIAYDWMYDYWTPERRAIMEKAIYQNCFEVACDGYTNLSSNMDGVRYKNNHNAFCNGGIANAAIAFMDVYPEVASNLIADSVRCLEYLFPVLAPDGCSYEGPSYAKLTAEYIVRMFAALESGIGKLYAIDRSAGLDEMAKSFLYLHSDATITYHGDAGGFSFNDGGRQDFLTPSVMWMYSHYGIVGYQDSVRDYYTRSAPSPNENAAQFLLFYNTAETTGDSDITLDKCYYDTGVATMRNTYEDNQVFVGIKAGDTVRDRSHLDQGSFVFDALGVRWAADMGKDSYGLQGYFDWRNGTKWNIFRQKAQSHNTLIIDPDMNPEFVLWKDKSKNIPTRANIDEFTTTKSGVKAIVDMDEVLADDATSATRGFLFTDNRQSLVVRDEVSLKKTDSTSTVYWLLYTTADAVDNGDNTVTLIDKVSAANDEVQTKEVTIEFVSNVKGEVVIEAATPMKNTPTVSGQNQNVNFKRIAYKISNASGDVNITAKLTPVGYSQSTVNDYNKPIEQWTLSE